MVGRGRARRTDTQSQLINNVPDKHRLIGAANYEKGIIEHGEDKIKCQSHNSFSLSDSKLNNENKENANQWIDIPLPSMTEQILTAITPLNLKKLAQEMLTNTVFTTEKIESSVELIFDLAILNPDRRQVYAALCKVLKTVRLPNDPDAKTSSPFRIHILNQCQKEFHAGIAGEIDHYDNMFNKVKSEVTKRMLGCILFTGALFNEGMVDANTIMTSCIEYLLKHGPEQDSVQCLTQLLSIVGSKLETECTQSSARVRYTFEQSLIKFGKIGSSKDLSAKTRQKVTDVMILRKKQWNVDPTKEINEKVNLLKL